MTTDVHIPARRSRKAPTSKPLRTPRKVVLPTPAGWPLARGTDTFREVRDIAARYKLAELSEVIVDTLRAPTDEQREFHHGRALRAIQRAVQALPPGTTADARRWMDTAALCEAAATIAAYLRARAARHG